MNEKKFKKEIIEAIKKHSPDMFIINYFDVIKKEDKEVLYYDGVYKYYIELLKPEKRYLDNQFVIKQLWWHKRIFKVSFSVKKIDGKEIIYSSIYMYKKDKDEKWLRVVCLETSDKKETISFLTDCLHY